ncbi:Ger(x)C family spore germination protein [Clostridium sporogenes]|uniref:Ger(x)C family spore germination protein n=1 Tax=Clostridium sporogenes TaxID=1509 RepID=UPI0007177B08|nr:Ger(x)C family spore germination protein [Clostridium sporogenes]MBA4506586.1 Ger(x)C family spore germination protein [Clostridium sporogenes]MBY7014649.1 Ger(x)C family spore germination protein [Clostridium sporogenes]MDU6334294.1 Ger(x)C family spore germination protein [Clostridium sporogenes]OQP91865.1 Ger(x)C family spore germination protein [Clostridium sporogenes]SQB31665.1 spore germination protein [Clostridium sporogenes]
MRITNKIKKFIIIIFCIFIGIIFSEKLDVGFAEELSIPSGEGFDVEEGVDGNLIYSIPVSIYTYQSNTEGKTIVYTGKGYTIGEAKQDRDKILSKKFVLGGERVFIISDKQAELGIHALTDALYNNTNVNDLGIVVVCNGTAEHILNYKPKGFPNSGEYIEGLVSNLRNNHFFSEDYKLIDVFVREQAEGRSIVLPYIELADDNIKATGMAIFKKDKMIGKINMKDSDILNFLRFNNVKGVLTLQKNYKEYINYKAQVKRKVKCTKKNEKYSFIINLDFNGEIISNELYKDITSKVDVKKQFEKDMSNKIEFMCNDFINRMKNQYKSDLLELGVVAAAKYGRNTNTDWDKVIRESEIKVNVNVNVDKFGRGDY